MRISLLVQSVFATGVSVFATGVSVFATGVSVFAYTSTNKIVIMFNNEIPNLSYKKYETIP
jgi:hypothetical protein